jgi:hypothetical protein
MKVPCQTCARSTRKGLLWLAADDWLECPDCNATGLVEVVEERFTPKERTVLIPGLRSHIERAYHPSVAHLQDIACRFTA